MRPDRVVSVFLVVLWLHAPRPAGLQTPTTIDPTGRQQVSDFRADVAADRGQSISLDVQVADKSGAPVPNLHAGDFTVLDNKQPQSIASVQAIDITSEQNEAPVEIILAIDAINVGKETVIEEFDWLHKYLDKSGKQLALPTSFAFLQDPNVTMQNHPARDTAALSRFLDSNRTSFRALRTSSGGWGDIEREQISLNELNSIAAQSARRPGRKLLLWIGPGWGEGPDPNARAIGKTQLKLFNEIVAESDELRKARITLEMVDPTISGGRIFNFNYEPFVKGISDARNAEYGHLMLPALAAQSGGQVLYGSTDLPALIDRCVADANSYYVVTYDLPHASHANEYHTIEIKIDRQDVVARTRVGYYAQP
jgi:VWFA-related protein